MIPWLNKIRENVMVKKQVLALFDDAAKAADANEAVMKEGVKPDDIEILTGCPYPEGAFGEHDKPHRVYRFPFIGALLGFSMAMLITAGTQLSWPLITGGKPILSLPPMVIIAYEGTLLGAVLFTIVGVLFESRLPRVGLGLYDDRITEGYIGLLLNVTEDNDFAIKKLLQKHGAQELKEEG